MRDKLIVNINYEVHLTIGSLGHSIIHCRNTLEGLQPNKLQEIILAGWANTNT